MGSSPRTPPPHTTAPHFLAKVCAGNSLDCSRKFFEKTRKKVLTKENSYVIIHKLSRTVSQTNENKSLDLVKIRIARFRFRKPLQKILKNLLTNTKQCDMIIKLSDDSQAKQKSLKKLKNNA